MRLTVPQFAVPSLLSTHMYNEGSGAGVLGHPTARKTRRRVLKSPAPERLIIHVCIKHKIWFKNIILEIKIFDCELNIN